MDNVETIIVTEPSYAHSDHVSLILRELRLITMNIERIADAQEKLVILLTKPDEEDALP